MKVKDLLNELATYNLEAEFEIYVNDKPAVFEICCGGSEGVTPSNCDHVTIFVNSTIDNDSYEFVEEVKHGYWSHIRNVLLDEIGTCSVCGERRDVDSYCSNCGAKMDSNME